MTPAALAVALVLSQAAPSTRPTPPAADPTPEEVGATLAGPLGVAPYSIAVGGGHHSAFGLGGWVLAARGGVRLRQGFLSGGPFVPELSLQVTYGRTGERLGLGRFRTGVTWWRELGRLHLGGGVSAGWLWVDGPGRLDPGFIVLLEAAAGVEVARVKGVRVSLEARGGLDPARASEPEGLVLLGFRY